MPKKGGPPNNKNAGKNLKPFKKNDPRINRNGRPPSVMTKIKQILKKEQGEEIKATMTEKDYRDVCMWMLEMNEDDLGKLAQNKETPIFIKLIAFAIAKDIKYGRLSTFDNIFDKFIGDKGKQLSDDKVVFVSGIDELAFDDDNVNVIEIEDSQIEEGDDEYDS